MRPKRVRPIISMMLLFTLAAGAAVLCAHALGCAVSARTAVVREVERAINKKVFFRSARIDLVRGLVLERLAVYDGHTIIIRADEVSCGFILPSAATRRIIIPAIRIDSPVIRSERREDNSLSILDLIPKDYAPKGGIPVSIHKIVIRNGRVDFTDSSLDPAFANQARNLSAEIKLYLPVRVTFRTSFVVPSASAAVSLSGEYIVPSRELVCDLAAGKVSLGAFLPYYRDAGITFPSGTVDARSSLRWKAGVMEAALQARTRELVASQGAVRSRLDSAISARVRLDGSSKKLIYAGSMDIGSMDIYGLEGVGKVLNIRGRVDFANDRARSESLRADALGMPWEARINIVNFRAPVVDVYCRSSVRLSALQQALADRLKITFPTEFSGKGELDLSIQMEPERPVKARGTLGISDATVSMGSGNFPIERARGKFAFTPDEVTWSGLRCAYRGVDYTASGKLVNFDKPRADLSVTSKDLTYDSEMVIEGKMIRLSKLKGRLFNSGLLASGEISLGDPAAIDADLKGSVSLDLADLKRLSTASGGMRKMRPAGKIAADFVLNGDLKNIGACYIDAKMRSKSISLYNLKFTGLSLEYLQEQGAASIKSIRSSFYGGTLTGNSRIDWLARAVPFSIKADASGVRLDSFKEVARFRDRDVSGTLKIYADLKGYVKDPSRITGLGHLSITKGRLWQLDLFKGAGALIFSSDFSEIVFTEGAFDYTIGGRNVYFDNFVMKSGQLDLYGRGRIGFDRSIGGILRPEIKDTAVSDGTAGAIAKAVGKGTVIEVDGTLTDLRFRTKTNVVDVVGAMLTAQE